MLQTHLLSTLNDMNPPRSDDLVAIGVITRARGIRGEVKVKPLTDFPDRFNTIDHVTLEMPDGSVSSHEVDFSRLVSGSVIMKITGYDDRNAAELLKGSYISVTLAETVPLDQDTYYVFDIEGMDVFDHSANRVGKIVRVEQYPANDIIVVSTEYGEIMIPAVKRYVTDVDKDTNRIIVNLPDNWPTFPGEVKK